MHTASISTESPVDPESPVGQQSPVDTEFPVSSFLFPCPAPLVVNPYIPDGFFFRSVVISMNRALQTAVRDSTGFLNDPTLQINERV